MCVFFPRKGVDNADLALELTTTVPGLYNRLDPTRYITLYDKKFSLVPPSTVGNGDTLGRRLRWYKKWKQTQNYDATGGVAKEPIIYFISDRPAGNATVLNLRGVRTITYKDI